MVGKYGVTTFAEVSELIDVVASFLALPEGGDPLTFPICWQALGSMRLVNSQWHAEATPRLWGMLKQFVSLVPLPSARNGSWLHRERRRFKRCAEAAPIHCELPSGMCVAISTEDAGKELLNSEEKDSSVANMAKAIDTAKPLRNRLCGDKCVCFVDYLLLASTLAFSEMDHEDFKTAGFVYRTGSIEMGVMFFTLKPVDAAESSLPLQKWTSSKVVQTSYLEDEAQEYFETMNMVDKETGLVNVECFLKELESDSFTARDPMAIPKFEASQITMTAAIDYMVEHFFIEY